MKRNVKHLFTRRMKLKITWITGRIKHKTGSIGQVL